MNDDEPNFESREDVDAYLIAHGYDLDALNHRMFRFIQLLRRGMGSRKQYHIRECYPGEPESLDDWRLYGYGDEDEMVLDMQEKVRRRFVDATMITHRFPVNERDYSIPVLIICHARRGGHFAPFHVFVTLDGVRE